MPSPQAGAPTTPAPQTARSSGDLGTAPASKDASAAPATPPPQTLRSSTDMYPASKGASSSEAPTTTPQPKQRSSGDLGTASASKDASAAPATPPPQTLRSSSDLDMSSASKVASEAPTSSPPPKQRSSSGLDTSSASKDAIVDPGFSSATGTIGDAAVPRPSSSPRRGGNPSIASRSRTPVSCPAVEETVTNGHDKTSADTGKEKGAVPSVLDQTSSSHAARMTNSKQQNHLKEEIDPWEGEVRDKRQYDMLLVLELAEQMKQMEEKEKEKGKRMLI